MLFKHLLQCSEYFVGPARSYISGIIDLLLRNNGMNHCKGHLTEKVQVLADVKIGDGFQPFGLHGGPVIGLRSMDLIRKKP